MDFSGKLSAPAVCVEDFMRLLEFLPDIRFWVKDSNGTFVAANEDFADIMGASSIKNLIGKTDFDFSQFHLAKEYVNDDNMVLRSRVPMINKMELIRDKTGKLAWYSTSKVPLRDGNERLWGTMGFTRRVHPDEKLYHPIRSMDSITKYINEHYKENITVKQLAQMTELSVVQFGRNFKKIFHTTPVKYINNIRIKAACQLLINTSLSINEISIQTGFRDQSYFTKQFQKVLGSLPKDYRAKHGKTN